jgi:iron complex transport system permease protein
MSDKSKLGILAFLAALLIGVFLFTGISGNWEYILSRRLTKIAAISLTGVAIAWSTVVFQTISNNRILTPSVIGLDSLYLLLQTFIVFFFGSMTLVTMNEQTHFLLSSGLMMAFAVLLFRLLFRGDRKNLFFLLLVGIVFGIFFGSITSFLQKLIDPNEFLFVQDRMFASFNNVNADILLLAFLTLGIAAVWFRRYTKYLDVLSLGQEHAVNLGIDYDAVVKRLLVFVALLVSVSTALVGPITFLGLLVTNVAYQLIRSYQHRVLIPASALIGVSALALGQLLVERVFTFTTTVSVIINFIGGVYFLYLLIRENKTW